MTVNIGKETMLTNIPVGEQINHMKILALSEIRFEWHPRTKKVYYVRVGVTPEIAKLIAEGIEDPLAAKNAVLIWGRGYLEGKPPAIEI